MRDNRFDAVITDPPYSSGGATRGERCADTRTKYISSGNVAAEYAKHNFEGDNLDARAWTSWCAEWLGECRRATRSGGVVAVFVDWRQLACLYDAIQWGGWILRGLVAWDKKNARPQPGRPRQQCEFIVWGSNGALDTKRNAPFLPGIFTCAPPSGKNRQHQTEKPVALLRELVHLCETGGHILDPFAGSGTTLVAGIQEGFDVYGIELDEYYHRIAQQRLLDAASAMTITNKGV